MGGISIYSRTVRFRLGTGKGSKDMAVNEVPARTTPRGFGLLDADTRRAIARKGGKAVSDEKRSFTQDRTLAAEAGRKGGKATQKKNADAARRAAGTGL
ncbi:MAG: stress-induced protein [Parcubacteria group bacterium]|nr:stress-induced protein [Parcubacteria group bacterium]